MTPKTSPFLSAEFSAIAHATENIENVEQSVRFLVGFASGSNVKLTRQYLRGHHGNMITTVSARLPGAELNLDALARLLRSLPIQDRQFLSRQISGCIDEGRNLYLRFDKQEAFTGNVRLQDGDPIRVRFKFGRAYDEKAIASLCGES